jgi:hypothetical protein
LTFPGFGVQQKDFLVNEDARQTIRDFLEHVAGNGPYPDPLANFPKEGLKLYYELDSVPVDRLVTLLKVMLKYNWD